MLAPGFLHSWTDCSVHFLSRPLWLTVLLLPMKLSWPRQPTSPLLHKRSLPKSPSSCKKRFQHVSFLFININSLNYCSVQFLNIVMSSFHCHHIYKTNISFRVQDYGGTLWPSHLGHPCISIWWMGLDGLMTHSNAPQVQVLGYPRVQRFLPVKSPYPSRCGFLQVRV